MSVIRIALRYFSQRSATLTPCRSFRGDENPTRKGLVEGPEIFESSDL